MALSCPREVQVGLQEEFLHREEDETLVQTAQVVESLSEEVFETRLAVALSALDWGTKVGIVGVPLVGFSGSGWKALETGVHVWIQVFIISYQ